MFLLNFVSLSLSFFLPFSICVSMYVSFSSRFIFISFHFHPIKWRWKRRVKEVKASLKLSNSLHWFKFAKIVFTHSNIEMMTYVLCSHFFFLFTFADVSVSSSLFLVFVCVCFFSICILILKTFQTNRISFTEMPNFATKLSAKVFQIASLEEKSEQRVGLHF